jgi:hypothetical protein
MAAHTIIVLMLVLMALDHQESVQRYLQEDADHNRLQLSQQFATIVQSRQ